MLPNIPQTATVPASFSMLPKGQTMLETADDQALQENLLSSQHGKAQLSSMVWIVIFCILMLLSIVTNTVYVIAVLTSKKKLTPIHVLLFSFFLINLVDYCLLIFEFYLGPNSNYQFSDASCSFYQFVLQGNPLLCTGTLLLLVYQAYSVASQPNHYYSFPRLLLQFSIILLTTTLLCIPSIIFSKVETFSDTISNTTSHCTMDLSSLSGREGEDLGSEKAITSIFLLTLKSVLPYWLPLALIIIPVLRMAKTDKVVVEKQLTVTIAIAVAVSFVVFHLPYSSVVFVRHLMSIINHSLTTYNIWVLHVFQSFFLLISFFFHIFRPLVCLLLDHELEIQTQLCRHRYRHVPVYKV